MRVGGTYYSWGNHKVVQYKGQFYDPSYDKVYSTTEEMAKFHYSANCTDEGEDKVDCTSGGSAYFRFGPNGTVTGPCASSQKTSNPDAPA